MPFASDDDLPEGTPEVIRLVSACMKEIFQGTPLKFVRPDFERFFSAVNGSSGEENPRNYNAVRLSFAWVITESLPFDSIAHPALVQCVKYFEVPQPNDYHSLKEYCEGPHFFLPNIPDLRNRLRSVWIEALLKRMSSVALEQNSGRIPRPKDLGSKDAVSEKAKLAVPKEFSEQIKSDSVDRIMILKMLPEKAMTSSDAVFAIHNLFLLGRLFGSKRLFEKSLIDLHSEIAAPRSKEFRKRLLVLNKYLLKQVPAINSTSWMCELLIEVGRYLIDLNHEGFIRHFVNEFKKDKVIGADLIDYNDIEDIGAGELAKIGIKYPSSEYSLFFELQNVLKKKYELRERGV